MARKIFLVSCVSSKRTTPLPARDLYCSDWFRKARAYVESQSAEWFILSARYGLVTPNQVMRPYNQTLADMSAQERRAWAQRVLDQLRPKCQKGDTVVILAGELYRYALVSALRQSGCTVEVPLQGLGIGQQLAWLKRQNQRASR